jgi:hypothetical protein
MKRLTEGGVAVTAVAEVMQLDDVVRAERLAASLVDDGLVELVDGGYRLSSTRR